MTMRVLPIVLSFLLADSYSPPKQVQEGKLTSLKQSIVWPDPEAVTNEITMDEYKAAKKEGKIWVTYKGRYDK